MTPWAWKGLGGRPVFNFRSDGRDFSHSLRCVIPADGFFEFTAPEAEQTRKTKWRFGPKGDPSFWIADLTKDGAFVMLTTEPGPTSPPATIARSSLSPKATRATGSTGHCPGPDSAKNGLRPDPRRKKFEHAVSGNVLGRFEGRERAVRPAPGDRIRR